MSDKKNIKTACKNNSLKEILKKADVMWHKFVEMIGEKENLNAWGADKK